jgi:hypothetical protein
MNDGSGHATWTYDARGRMTGSGSTNKTIRIRAKSTACNDGVCATMKLWVNGSKIKTWANVAAGRTTYSQGATLSGNDQIEVVFTSNTSPQPDTDTDLISVIRSELKVLERRLSLPN